MSIDGFRPHRVAYFAAALLFLAGPAHAEGEQTLADRLTPDRIEAVFPGAEAVERATGRPNAAEVRRGDAVVGYILSVADIADARGYDGAPFDILVGIDLDAIVTGAVLIAHDEPLLRTARADRALADMVAGLAGLDALAPAPVLPADFAGPEDSSALIMLDAVSRAARAVAVSRELKGPSERDGRLLDREAFMPRDWPALRAMGAVRRLALSNGDLAAAGATAAGGPSDMDFVTLYAGLATPALIGRNLVGADAHQAALDGLAPNDQLLFVATAGRALITDDALAAREDGSQPVLRVRQDGGIAPLDVASLLSPAVTAAGAPPLDQSLLAILPGGAINPTRPWTLELAFATPAGETVFGLPYTPPATVVREPVPHIIAVADNRAASVPPVWTAVWRDQGVRLGVLAAALAVLTAIVLAQGRLARRPKLLARIRIGFLAFTLVWIGWFAGAQLSVSHLMSLARAPFEAGHLSALMFDPLILLLIGFVGLSLLLLGRGVFCGWLCPFGALQELLNKAARRFGVTQWRVPVGLNERLWAVKYLVLILLLGAAFADRSFAARAVEIEPFTTSILLGFVRYWPYVAFAVALLAIGLVVERFYCRFLCPLGAGLAILGRWRMVSWLKRRPECGNSCATCQGLCPVQAIGDDGAINLNECYQCLSCQVAYNDNHVCPPLIARRERLERLSGGGAYERKRAAAPAVQ